MNSLSRPSTSLRCHYPTSASRHRPGALKRTPPSAPRLRAHTLHPLTATHTLADSQVLSCLLECE